MRHTISVIAFMLLSSLLSAQQTDSKFLSRLNVAAGFSTLGYGIEAATPIHQNLNLRAGINFFNFTSKDNSISLDETADEAFQTAYGYVPDYNVDGKLNFVNADVLVDWHPMRGGIFHFTGGVYIGSSKLSANGFLVDPSTGDHAELLDGQDPPEVVVDDYTLTVTEDAALDTKAKLGKLIKPYFGLGLGKAVTKNRIGFRFELGMLYQGDLSLSQNGYDLEKVVTKTRSSIKDVDTYLDLARWWPMVNFQLTFRVF